MSEIVDKAKALMTKYEQLLEHTRTERDQLRAELARLQRNEDCVQRLIMWATENGWNGVDNSKILDSFIIGLFDELRAELEKLRGELDDAEERAIEAEERCAAEWEKDCGQALRILAQVTKFEWDQDGSPADEVLEHIQITLESLEKQVSSLRAELAAAKNRALIAEKQDERSRHLVCLWKDDREAQAKALSAMTAERDQLRADNARLRKALSGISDRLTETSWRRDCDHIRRTCDEIGCNGAKFRAIEELLQAALAATPAQFLAAHDAALLREVANKFETTEIDTETREPSESYDCGYKDGQYSAVNWLMAKADRIEKEAADTPLGAVLAAMEGERDA